MAADDEPAGADCQASCAHGPGPPGTTWSKARLVLRRARGGELVETSTISWRRAVDRRGPGRFGSRGRRIASDASDEELMARVGQGDVFAYRALVERHIASLYRTACRLLHDRQEAEDVVQESFARLWQGAARWKAVGAGLPAWLGRVCTNLCMDRLRRNGRWSSADLPEIVDPAIAADRLIEQGECREILQSCLEALPGNHRAAIVLTYYEGHPNKTAAGLMEMDVKAFESLLHRARRKLGALLADGGVAPQDLGLLA